MAWRRPGDKPLSEPMIILLMHICVTRPQWVNCLCDEFCRGNMKMYLHFFSILRWCKLLKSFLMKKISCFFLSVYSCRYHFTSYVIMHLKIKFWFESSGKLLHDKLCSILQISLNYFVCKRCPWSQYTPSAWWWQYCICKHCLWSQYSFNASLN